MPQSANVRYAIVAAGILNRRAPAGPVFNGLKLVGAGPVDRLPQGELKFIYSGYTPPDGSFQTIVKVLPVFGDQTTAIVPAFLRFENDGFSVRLTDGVGTPLDPATLVRTTVMVEVSEYGRLVSIP